jgi:hypothetical protein
LFRQAFSARLAGKPFITGLHREKFMPIRQPEGIFASVPVRSFVLMTSKQNMPVKEEIMIPAM